MNIGYNKAHHFKIYDLFSNLEYDNVSVAGGRVSLEFTAPLPKYWKEVRSFLALRDYGDEPAGAGMFVRRNVANLFCELVEKNVCLSKLGRKGQTLAGPGFKI